MVQRAIQATCPINALEPQERYRVYRMIGMETHLTTDVSCGPSEGVMNCYPIDTLSA
jgi:hypothetical protein